MRHLFLGIGVLLFGLFVGGVGIATAGVGIGIPMIPIGIYLSYRGWRIYKYEQALPESDVINPEPLKSLENTKKGRVGLGVLIILVGIGTSAMLIGIPLIAVGAWFIYDAVTNNKYT